MVALQDLGGLDTLPCRGDLDQDTVLGDTLCLVELLGRGVSNESLVVLARLGGGSLWSYVDDVQGLVDGGLGVEGEASVDLCGDLAGDDLEDLLAELNQQAVEGGVHLCVDVTAGRLGVLDGLVNQLRVLGLLRGSEYERRVGGGILGLVFADGGEVARVGDDDGAGGLELIQGVRHDECGGVPVWTFVLSSL